MKENHDKLQENVSGVSKYIVPICNTYVYSLRFLHVLFTLLKVPQVLQAKSRCRAGIDGFSVGHRPAETVVQTLYRSENTGA